MLCGMVNGWMVTVKQNNDKKKRKLWYVSISVVFCNNHTDNNNNNSDNDNNNKLLLLSLFSRYSLHAVSVVATRGRYFAPAFIDVI